MTGGADELETEILQKAQTAGKVGIAAGLVVLSISGLWWFWRFYQEVGLTPDLLGQVGSMILIVGFGVYLLADVRMRDSEDDDHRGPGGLFE